MTEYEKMISGKLYDPKKIEAAYSYQAGRRLVQKINLAHLTGEGDIAVMENELIDNKGNLHITPPLSVDYGFNIHVGKNFYANMDCVFLDVAEIFIGDDVMFGPRVSLITATHPIDAGVRTRGLELGQSIEIGNRVWLGANVTVNPGVKIGDETIVGSGSVVTKDLPAGVIAVGNPAKILRKIDLKDKKVWEAKENEYFSDLADLG